MKAGQVDTGRFYFFIAGNRRVTESLSNVSGSQFPSLILSDTLSDLVKDAPGFGVELVEAAV